MQAPCTNQAHCAITSTHRAVRMAVSPSAAILFLIVIAVSPSVSVLQLGAEKVAVEVEVGRHLLASRCDFLSRQTPLGLVCAGRHMR